MYLVREARLGYAGNVGNLPIVLVQSICSNGKSPYSQLLPNGTCEQKGIAYVAFSMWIASTFQYCIAFNMLKKPEKSADLSKLSSGAAPEVSQLSCGALGRLSVLEDRGRVMGIYKPPSFL